MSSTRWLDLSDFGVSIKVSPPNKFRSKIPFLIIEDNDKFLSLMSANHPKDDPYRVLLDSNFYELENKEGLKIFYYKNPNQVSLSLSDVKNIFPGITKDFIKSVPNDQLYVNLPFNKYLKDWQTFFSSIEQEYNNLPDFYFYENKDDFPIFLEDRKMLDIYQESLNNSNPYYYNNSFFPLPISKLDQYGYNNFFEKLYLTKEAALSDGVPLDSIRKSKLSPFKLPVNIEKDGSVLVISDLRNIPEIFSYHPTNDLKVNQYSKVFKETLVFDELYNEIIDHSIGFNLFKISPQSMGKVLNNLSSDLFKINSKAHFDSIERLIPKEYQDEGIPLLSNTDGVWYASTSKDADKILMDDEQFYKAMLFRYFFLEKMLKTISNPKNILLPLYDSYTQISVNSVSAINNYLDWNSSKLKAEKQQNELDQSVNKVIADNNVNFGGVEFTPIDLLSKLDFAGGVKESPKEIKTSSSTTVIDPVNIKAHLSDLLSIPNDILNGSNPKVLAHAPAMLVFRQILDAYLIPAHQKRIKELDFLYTEKMSEFYNQIQDQVSINLKNNSIYDTSFQNLISDAILEYQKKYNIEVGKSNGVIQKSEFLINGINVGVSDYLYNKDSYYFLKKENGMNILIDSEKELEIKNTIFENINLIYNNNITFDVFDSHFRDIVGNDEAILILSERVEDFKSSPVQLVDEVKYNDFELFDLDILLNDDYVDSQSLALKNILISKNIDQDVLFNALSATSIFSAKDIYDLFSRIDIPLAIESNAEKNITGNLANNIKNFNYLLSVSALNKALNDVYPSKKWDSIFDSEKTDSKIFFKLYLDSFNTGISLSHREYFIISNNFLKHIYKSDISTSEGDLYVQSIKVKSIEDSIYKINKEDYDSEKHYKLSFDYDQAVFAAFDRVKNLFLADILLLREDQVLLAKNIATTMIANDQESFDKYALEFFDKSFELDDFRKLIYSVDQDLYINNPYLKSNKHFSYQIQTFLELVKLYDQNALGLIDKNESNKLSALKDFIINDSNFKDKYFYFKISSSELNSNILDEKDFLKKQVLNSISVASERYDLNEMICHIGLIKLNHMGQDYFRLVDINNSFYDFSLYSLDEVTNSFKDVSLNKAIYLSSILEFHLNTNSSKNFNPPTLYTLNKYYDNNLDHYQNMNFKSSEEYVGHSLPIDFLLSSLGKKEIEGNLRSSIQDELDGYLDSGDLKSFESKLVSFDVNQDISACSVNGNVILCPKNLLHKFNLNGALNVKLSNIFPEESLSFLKNKDINGLLDISVHKIDRLSLRVDKKLNQFLSSDKSFKNLFSFSSDLTPKAHHFDVNQASISQHDLLLNALQYLNSEILKVKDINEHVDTWYMYLTKDDASKISKIKLTNYILDDAGFYLGRYIPQYNISDLSKYITYKFPYSEDLFSKLIDLNANVNLDADIDLKGKINSAVNYLGDVGKKIGGAHKDRYGEYISLDYISENHVDQISSDYRKSKIISNKGFQDWFKKTNLDFDDKIFIKAIYDYFPPKPLFSKDALMVDSLRLTELKIYLALLDAIKDKMMVNSSDELKVNLSKPLIQLSDFGVRSFDEKNIFSAYTKGSKYIRKNYVEVAYNFHRYYFDCVNSRSISSNLDDIVNKTLEKTIDQFLLAGQLFDFYHRLKDPTLSVDLSELVNTGFVSDRLIPYVKKNAIETGLVKIQKDSVNTMDNGKSPTQSAPVIPVNRSNKEVVRPFEITETTISTNKVSVKVSSPLYGLSSFSRTGENYRLGKDVGSFEVKETFGLKAIELGNNIKPVAQPLMNILYDSLMDLKKITNFQSKDSLLDLSISLASRGIKSTAAHYDPGLHVVNLTRDNGAGSLLHEYAHALDAYIGYIEKTEVFKQGKQHYYKAIPGFLSPSSKVLMTTILDQGFEPLTDVGSKLEDLYLTMRSAPKLNENLPNVRKQLFDINDSLRVSLEIIDNFSRENNLTVVSDFFEWYEEHYVNGVYDLASKFSETIKNSSEKIKNDVELDFLSRLVDKYKLQLTKLNTEIKDTTYLSFSKNYAKRTGQSISPDEVKKRVSFVIDESGFSDIKKIEQMVLDKVILVMNAEMYSEVEKNIPVNISNPYTRINEIFNFYASNDFRNSNISKYFLDCKNLDANLSKSKPYYSTSSEMFARYMETYFLHKTHELELENTFLIETLPRVYPKGYELEVCYASSEKFIDYLASNLFNSKELQVSNDHQNDKIYSHENDYSMDR